MSRNKPLKNPDAGFNSIKLPERLVPCAAEPEEFDRAQSLLEERRWLANLSAVAAICNYCIGCPIIRSCGDAARAERYHGIAGGRIWRNGKDVSERVAA